MFASSSKRARSSMTTVTSLPTREASISALTNTERSPVRYSVCFIASTSGSAAARRTSSMTGT